MCVGELCYEYTKLKSFERSSGVDSKYGINPVDRLLKDCLLKDRPREMAEKPALQDPPSAPHAPNN